MESIKTIKDVKKYIVEDDNGCWIWQLSKRGKGYAQITDWRTGKQDAQRVVWRIANYQDIPEGKIIRHLCDIKACVNPEHLELSTNSQNIKDIWERHPRREEFRESVRHRTRSGKLKKAFLKGRMIGMPRGLNAMNGVK